MDIKVVSAVGKGDTKLAAFDNALQQMGVSNYNLIYLSSIIPPQSKVTKIGKYITPPGEFGHRLYVVRADVRCDLEGYGIAAGVGWYQLEDNRGFFVEHSNMEKLLAEAKTISVNELHDLTREQISLTLRDMCKFRNIPFDPKNVHSAISATEVKGMPVCALSMAVYESEGWAK